MHDAKLQQGRGDPKGQFRVEANHEAPSLQAIGYLFEGCAGQVKSESNCSNQELEFGQPIRGFASNHVGPRFSRDLFQRKTQLCRVE